jgi:hypothetical protein
VSKPRYTAYRCEDSYTIVIVDTYLDTATSMFDRQAFDDSIAKARQLGDELKALIAPAFRPLPRRRIPWTAPKVWASQKSVIHQHHNPRRKRPQWQKKKQQHRRR